MRVFRSSLTCKDTRRPFSYRNRSRPQLEALEDRTAPALFKVNTALDTVVPGDGKRSLREAITSANTSPGADVIVLPGGALRITRLGVEDGNSGGDFDISGTVTIQGAGADKTVIDGQQLDRVLDAVGSAPHSIKLVLLGLTVRGGNVAGNGGGIQATNADLLLRDCVVIG